MTVDPLNAGGGSAVREGKTYYFCNPKCREKFLRGPSPIEAPGAEYTCPMHPEIVRPGPGPCPICGNNGDQFNLFLDFSEPTRQLGDARGVYVSFQTTHFV